MNRRASLVLVVLAAGCSSEPTGNSDQALAKGGGTIDPPPTVIAPPPPPTVGDCAAQYSAYDLDRDGNLELDSLGLMSFETAADPPGKGSMVVVFVEKRIVDAGGAPLVSKLQTFRDDLVGEGYRPRFVVAALHRDGRREDGKKLLAMRRFLQCVRGTNSSLEGTILVGSFPDATIFRRTLLADAAGLRMTLHAERINTRADIVLGDLDGNWESLYVASGTMVSTSIRTYVPPTPWAPGASFSGPWDSYEETPWHDYFYLREDSVTVSPSTVPLLGQYVTFKVATAAMANPETTALDRLAPNPVAQPELVVSRIDARHIAIDPDLPPDFYGRRALDANGHPQALAYPSNGPPPFKWAENPALEQRILIDYLNRDHAFRHGSDGALPYRTASTRGPVAPLLAPTLNPYLKGIDPTGFTTPIDAPDANLTDYIDWLKQPAVVRGILAHSNNTISQFTPPVSPDLSSFVGGPAFTWAKGLSASWVTYTPMDQQPHAGGSADWELGRALFEYRALIFAGQAFYVHDGCGLNVATIGDGPAYDSPDYALRNNADSILFFLNGLAVFARGKTFNDLPTNAMTYAAQNGKRFGYGWKGQYIADAANGAANPLATADARVLAAKKAYFWSLLGDFTLKIRY